MNYDESLAYIESLAPTILNPDLARFSAFVKLHGNPQDQCRSFHVAGTNGKGSTVAIIDSALRCAGYKVGRFTGPHLLRWNERFHLNGMPIGDHELACLVTRLRELSEEFGKTYPEHGKLTWFELLTAVAFFYFAENKVDYAVFEVGLGGRWDATNVISHPVVSTITTIDYDHVHILGSTLSQIAGEKAGIIKSGVPVVTGTSGDALDTISKRAAELNAPLHRCVPPDAVSYQQFNAMLAAETLKVADAVQGTSLSSYLSDGIARVYWPGRFQYLPERKLILDGAHNVAGARALRVALDKNFPNQKRVFVLSFYQNKDVPGALEALLRTGDRVFASQAVSTRAVFSADQIVQASKELGATAESAPSIETAFNRAKAAASAPDQIIIATGSFATVKETMQSMGWKTVEDGMKSTYGLVQNGCKIHT